MESWNTMSAEDKRRWALTQADGNDLRAAERIVEWVEKGFPRYPIGTRLWFYDTDFAAHHPDWKLVEGVNDPHDRGRFLYERIGD